MYLSMAVKYLFFYEHYWTRERKSDWQKIRINSLTIINQSSEFHSQFPYSLYTNDKNSNTMTLPRQWERTRPWPFYLNGKYFCM